MTFAQEHQEVDSELGHGQEVPEQKKLEEKAKQKTEDEPALSHRQKLLTWNLCGDGHGRWWNCPEEFGRVDGHTKLCPNAQFRDFMHEGIGRRI